MSRDFGVERFEDSYKGYYAGIFAKGGLSYWGT